MGRNYYIDLVDRLPAGFGYSLPHIGRLSNRTFTFYISRDHQIALLSSMDPDSFVVDEEDIRTTVKSFLEKFSNFPFSEEEREFC